MLELPRLNQSTKPARRDRVDYRKKLFALMEDNFSMKFEKHVEPGLHSRSAKLPCYSCLVVCKALRLLMRLKVTEDGTLAWLRPDSFTEDDALMTSREQLFRMCRKIKPRFSYGQMRSAITVLRKYRLLWTKQGRKPNGKQYEGCIIYARFNVETFLKAFSGQPLIATAEDAPAPLRPEERRNRQNARVRELKARSPSFKIASAVRTRVRGALHRALSGKKVRTTELLGCTWDSFVAHLEAKFQPGMSWANYGEGPGRRWEIDHVRPCASFDLTDPSQQRECFHWSNQQPLWKEDNARKGSKEGSENFCEILNDTKVQQSSDTQKGSSSSREEGREVQREVKALSVSSREKEIMDLLTKTPNLFQGKDGWDQHCAAPNILTLEQFREVRRLIRQGTLTVKFVQDYCSFMSLGVGWLVGSNDKPVWWANCDITFFLLRCPRVRRELYLHQANEFEATALPTPDDDAILEDLRTKAFVYYHVDPSTDRVDPRFLAYPAPLPRNPTENDCRTTTEQEAVRAITAVRAFESGQIGDPAYAQVMRSAEPSLRAWLRKNPHHAEWCLRNLPSFCKWIDISHEDRWHYRRDAVQLDHAEKARPWLVAQARQRCFWR